MVRFLISIALVSLGDLGVTLALGHTSHSQIHADLAALALKVCAQTVHDLLRHALGLADAHHMLGDVGVAGLFHKCRGRSLADGALSRDLAFSNITTNGANIFLHKNRPPSFSVFLLTEAAVLVLTGASHGSIIANDS